MSCPRCGSLVAENGRCPSCGATRLPLSPTPPPASKAWATADYAQFQSPPPPRPGFRAFASTSDLRLVFVVLVILAFVALAIGALLLTQMTLGVGIVAGGCLLGILARIAQAGVHHRELLEESRKPGDA